NEQCYISINIVVCKNDHPTQLANELKEKENRLFNDINTKEQNLCIKEKVEIEPKEWLDTVREAKEHIKKTEVEKIVLAREMRLKFQEEANIGTVLRNLFKTQPNSYIFAFEKDGDCFVGATPERLV